MWCILMEYHGGLASYELPMRGPSGEVYFCELVLELSSSVRQAVVGLAGWERPAGHLVTHRGHRGHRGGLAGTDQAATVPAVPGGVETLHLPGLISPPAPTARLVVGLVVMSLLSLLVVLVVSVMRLAMPSSHKYRVAVGDILLRYQIPLMVSWHCYLQLDLPPQLCLANRPRYFVKLIKVPHFPSSSQSV